MGSMRRYKRVAAWMLVDYVVIWAAYTGAYSTRALTSSLSYINHLHTILLMAVPVIFSLYLFGVYDRIWSRTSGHGASIIVNAVLVATGGITVVNLISSPHLLPTSVILVGNVLAAGAVGWGADARRGVLGGF